MKHCHADVGSKFRFSKSGQSSGGRGLASREAPWAESVAAEMAMTTVVADASQSLFEFLHSELVSYLQDKAPGSDKVGQEGVTTFKQLFSPSSQRRSHLRLMLSRNWSS